MFLGAPPVERRLAQLATSTPSQAFADSNKKAYITLFRAFLAFVAFMHWQLHQVDVLSLLCFLECLHFNGVKSPQMANYLSIIKTKLIIYGLYISCFPDDKIKLYQRAVKLHSPNEFQVK